MASGDDDTKPIDVAIRPALPSRACSAETFMEQRPLTPPKPMFRDEARADKPSPPSLQPSQDTKPRRKRPVKQPQKLDRSAIAKEAWKTRRRNAKLARQNGSPAPTRHAAPKTVDGVEVLTQMIGLLNTLPAEKRSHVTSLLHGLVS